MKITEIRHGIVRRMPVRLGNYVLCKCNTRTEGCLRSLARRAWKVP